MTDAIPSSSDELVVLNGRLTPVDQAFVSVADHGFLRGDGVFEALRVYAGVPFGVEQHLARLERSASGVRLDGVDVDLLRAEIAQIIAARGGADYALRIICTRGGSRLVMTEAIADYPEAVRLGYVTYQPTVVLSGLKTLSYAGNVLASRLAQERGFDEALLVTPNHEVLEAPTASLFWVDADNRLVTPPLGDGILASITRQALIDLMDVDQRVTLADDLLSAREAFLCSSIREVQSIGRIESIEFEAPGPLTSQASELLSKHIQASII